MFSTLLYPDSDYKLPGNANIHEWAKPEVATKRDIERLEAKLEARFERVDGELRLNRWMMGVLLAGVVS
jgi:hypothetical protein